MKGIKENLLLTIQHLNEFPIKTKAEREYFIKILKSSILSIGDIHVFILFQTDVHKTKKSRVCFGVFGTEVEAIDAARENDLYSHESEVVIIETTLNQFGEV
jgi:hypothetical protein